MKRKLELLDGAQTFKTVPGMEHWQQERAAKGWIILKETFFLQALELLQQALETKIISDASHLQRLAMELKDDLERKANYIKRKEDYRLNSLPSITTPCYIVTKQRLDQIRHLLILEAHRDGGGSLTSLKKAYREWRVPIDRHRTEPDSTTVKIT